MPAFNFTADAGTDQITTSAPHGLVTGDGPGALRNIGGALPAATPTLTPVTDYWFIVIDATHLKISTSNAAAMAGTFVDLTGTGTGTQVLEIGIPYRRPRTFAAGVQVPSRDLNGNFDAHIALYGLLTHQAQNVFATPVIPVPRCSPGFTASAADAAATVPAGTTSPSGRHMPIGGLAVGSTITAVRARVADDGATDKLVVLLTVYDPGADGGAPASSTADVAGTTSSASSGGGLTETIQKTGIAIKVAAGVTYNVCVRKSNGVSTTSRVLHAEIEAI